MRKKRAAWKNTRYGAISEEAPSVLQKTRNTDTHTHKKRKTSKRSKTSGTVVAAFSAGPHRGNTRNFAKKNIPLWEEESGRNLYGPADKEQRNESFPSFF